MLAVDSPLLDRELHGKDVVSKVDRWVRQNYVFRIGDDNPPSAAQRRYLELVVEAVGY